MSVLIPVFLLLAIPFTFGCGGGSGGTSDAPGSGGEKRIILLTNGDDPFWDCMREGMNKAAEDLKLAEAGMVVELDKNDGKPKGQVDKLKQYASRSDIAAVMISVIEPNNIAIYKAMKELQDQGIKVITIDSDISPEKADARTVYVGTDNLAAGRELGKAAKALVDADRETHKFAAFSGYPDTDNASKRVAGFAEAAGDTFTLTENLGDELNHSTAQRNVRTALDNNEDIDVLAGIWAYNAHAIVEVVKERKVRDQTTIVVFDAASKAIKHMEEGSIDCMVVQNPYQMGYLGTKLMKAMLEDDQAVIKEMFPNQGQPGGDVYSTEIRVVAPSAGGPLKPEVFAESTIFFTLDDFKVWLDERGLSGS